MRRWRRRLSWGLGSALILLLLSGAVIYSLLRSSLPLLNGEQIIAGLRAEVNVERDGLGVPVIHARNRRDASCALGFVHAQERFFQMDLSRRRAAGELSELVGGAALDVDKSARLHRFRHRAQTAFSQAPAEQRELIEAYTECVNAGLQSLGKPFEYFLLRSDPRPWQNEDTFLVGYAMYFTLQNAEGGIEFARKLARETLPAVMFHWLTSAAGEWEALVSGEPLDTPAMPSAGELAGWTPKLDDGIWPADRPDTLFPGSNNWAVSGAVSSTGRAILANDMHLGLSVPNTWYRAQLRYDDRNEEIQVTGVSLPGTPVIVAGSNRQVAWGFTNSYGDWADVIALDLVDAGRYRTRSGDQALAVISEEIAIKGTAPVILQIEESIWGPVIRRVNDREAYVLRWVAHDPGRGVDLSIQKLETARSAGEAIAIANDVRMPAQNFVVADRGGAIGWTIAGAIPRRMGYDGRDIVSWADGSAGWDGYLEAPEYPQIQDPPGGRIWTANNRVVNSRVSALIGDGGYDLGARAKQIRDRLYERERHDERDLLAIQIDDEARFLQRWQRHLLTLLDSTALDQQPGRASFRGAIENWGGHASIESAGYRFVRGYRLLLRDTLYRAWLAATYARDGTFNPFDLSAHWETMVWQTLQQGPAHLLPQPYKNWRELQLAVIDTMIRQYQKKGELAGRSWGERNTAGIRHPLSGAVPLLSRWLDAPAEPLSGDTNMPRVQSPAFGASMRLVVSPGHEERGIFHMPLGQSGHPLSPFYLAGHAAWVKGEPTPFLPGPTAYRLTLKPAP